MIVLDEQLLGRNLELEISRWYQGSVVFITDLRPYTVIKDEVIPEILRHQNQPTFITINEKDFWRKAKMNERCCIICFTLPDSRVHEISQRLRDVFRKPEFSAKAKRMGKILRVTVEEISYYTSHHKSLRKVLF